MIVGDTPVYLHHIPIISPETGRFDTPLLGLQSVPRNLPWEFPVAMITLAVVTLGIAGLIQNKNRCLNMKTKGVAA